MIKNYRTNTAGRRMASVIDFRELTKKEPEKKLTKGLTKKSGRANGKISTRHKGGGHKRLYRLVDFFQKKFDIPGRVEAIEYDPNRTCFVALVVYKDGKKDYVLAAEGMTVGTEVITSEKASIKIGNRLPLKNIPVGTQVFNIEMVPGKGGQIARTGGSYAMVTTKEGNLVHLTMPSGEIRIFFENSLATVGAVSNSDHRNVNLGKAGRARWLGIRPTVRGSAMNPVDHRHGGGEGRQPIGLRRPVTPWGKPALGVKTRNKKKITDKFIFKRRNKKK